MNQSVAVISVFAGAVLSLSLSANAQMRVQYGRITNVQATTVTDTTARTVGTLVGGGVGLATGSGQSGSNRALRGIGGAAAGRGVGSLAGRSQAFEYTVLVDGTSTVRIVSDQAGKRIGDCVAVEQGQFSNIRLVPDARCAPRAQAAPAKAARPRLHHRRPPKSSRPLPVSRPRNRFSRLRPTRSSTWRNAACDCSAANDATSNRTDALNALVRTWAEWAAATHPRQGCGPLEVRRGDSRPGRGSSGPGPASTALSIALPPATPHVLLR